MTLLDEVLDFLHYHPHAKRTDIEQGIAAKVSPATIKRTVAANDYRAALLLFYEQNNLSAFKRIFLDQVAFAVREYF